MGIISKKRSKAILSTCLLKLLQYHGSPIGDTVRKTEKITLSTCSPPAKIQLQFRALFKSLLCLWFSGSLFLLLVTVNRILGFIIRSVFALLELQHCTVPLYVYFITEFEMCIKYKNGVVTSSTRKKMLESSESVKRRVSVVRFLHRGTWFQR